MTVSIHSKLPNVGTTIFSVMSQLAESSGAINLSQGFPDYQPPEALVNLVKQALSAHYHQYAPMIGVEALRVAIASMLSGHYGVTADPDTEITVTSGATEALFAAIHAVVRQGDEVIVFDPAYDSYVPAIELAGGRAVRLALEPSTFAIDWDRFERALSAKTRLVIVNSPHNPTGTILQSSDLDRLAGLLRPTNCLVLSDEVYEHIIFDGHAHATVLAHQELAQRSFAVFSFGKTFHATGWKVGYCVAPVGLSAEFRRIHQYLTFSTTTPLQVAIAQYLQLTPEHYRELGKFYQTKRDYFRNLLAPSKFRLLPCQGTYFQLADFSEMSESLDVEFCRWLTVEHGVATIPVSVFCAKPTANQHLARFCFAKDNTTLDAAAARLRAI